MERPPAARARSYAAHLLSEGVDAVEAEGFPFLAQFVKAGALRFLVESRVAFLEDAIF